MARQKLGQHFLSDLSWRKRILQTLHVARGENWLEIGAGHGEMTELLARAGANVVAIETDSKLAEGLAKHSPGWGNVQVVPGDVLQLDLRALATRAFAFTEICRITSPRQFLRRLFAITDQHPINRHRHSIRSRGTHRCASRRPRARISLCALPVLRQAKNRTANSGRRLPPAAGSNIRACKHDHARRASKLGNHR